VGEEQAAAIARIARTVARTGTRKRVMRRQQSEMSYRTDVIRSLGSCVREPSNNHPLAAGKTGGTASVSTSSRYRGIVDRLPEP
jgi:hypothetical protein